jgi:hypothetical protein
MTTALIAAAMQQATGIAEKTRSTYVSSLERLEANVPDKRGLVGVLLAPERAYQTLQQRGELSLQTRRAYMAAAVSVFKHIPDKVLAPLLKTRSKEAVEDLRRRWIVLLRRQTDDAFSKYGTMNASQHQRDNYIPWEEWIRVRDATLVKARAAPLGDVAICDAALLISMLTYIPPVRADFNKVRIVREAEAEAEAEEARNRIVVSQDGSMKLVLTEFKTAGPRFERIESPFPSELTKIVEWALAKRRTLWTTPGPRADRAVYQGVQPWTWLFVSPVSGMPYENADVASGHMRSLLRLVFGGSKLVGFNLARHAFINSLDFNKLSPNDLKSIAARMGHSIDQQQQYRLRITPTT